MDALLDMALANALTAAALAVPAALAARVGRSPALAHALWLLVLLKLITPPLLPVRLPWADPLAADHADRDRPLAAPAVPLPPAAAPAPAANAAELEPPHRVVERTRVGHEPAAWQPLGERLTWRGFVLAVWLAGSALWWATALVRVGRFRRLLRHAAAASPELQARARDLAARLGLARCPAVGLLPARVSPLLWAVGWTPRLLLPADLWERLSAGQRDALLAHELAHLRRGDHWVRRLELVVLGLFWWHPVAWWARRELAEAEEACCDAWVLWALPEAGPSYAAALVATAAFLSEARTPVPVAASGAGRVHTLKRRLVMILQKPCPRTLSRLGLLAVLGVGAMLLPLLPTWAADEAPAHDPGVTVPAAAKEAPGDPARKPQGRAARSRQVEELRDEVVLLEAKRAVCHAQLQAARTILEHAARRGARAKALFEKGAISREEVAQTRGWLEQAKADVLAGEARLRESEVRLEQARRRLAALPARAEAAAQPPVSADGWAERLFDTRVLDVRVAPGEKVTGRIRLVNRTPHPVRIGSVRSSAGALTAVLGRTVLAPGSKSFIDFTVDGRRFSGAKVFTLYVTFDQPAAAEVRVNVRAFVAGGGGGIASDDRARLQALEKQLEMLRKEVEALRKTLPKRPPAGGTSRGPAPVRTDSRTITIPFDITAPSDPAAMPHGHIREVRLFASTDGGLTWRLAASALPQDGAFRYVAPADGTYDFNIAYVDPTGRQQPADFSKMPAALRVIIPGR